MKAIDQSIKPKGTLRIEFFDRSIIIYRRFTNKFIFNISHMGKHFDAHYDNDFKGVCIDYTYCIDRKTANIQKETFVWILKQMYKEMPFKRIAYLRNGYYKLNAEELMKEVLNEE